MSADPPAMSIKLSRRGTFANPSRIFANGELARTCANVRKSANLPRIRKSVANLSRTRPTRCEL
eukprot:535463-Prymnesium_polylepis.1